MEENDFYLVKKEDWNSILGLVTELSREIERLKAQQPPMKKILSNKDLQEVLHVNGKLIRKYRNDGLLDYSHAADTGGKYWYTSDDVMNFIKNTRK